MDSNSAKDQQEQQTAAGGHVAQCTECTQSNDDGEKTICKRSPTNPPAKVEPTTNLRTMPWINGQPEMTGPTAAGPTFQANNMNFHSLPAGFEPVMSSEGRAVFQANTMNFGSTQPLPGSTSTDDGFDYVEGGARKHGSVVVDNETMTEVKSYAKGVLNKLIQIEDKVNAIGGSNERHHEKLAKDVKDIKSSVLTTSNEVTDIRTTQAGMGRDLCSVHKAQIDLAIGMEDVKCAQDDLAREVENIQITQEKDGKKLTRGVEMLEKIHRDTGEMKGMMSVALNQQSVSGLVEEPPTSSYRGRVRQHFDAIKKRILAMKVASELFMARKLPGSVNHDVSNAHHDGNLDKAAELLMSHVLRESEEFHEHFVTALKETGQDDLYNLLTDEGFVLEESHVERLRQCWRRLIETMYIDEGLWASLYERNAVDEDERQLVFGAITHNQKVDRLLMLFCRKSYYEYQELLQALNATGQQHVVALLNGPEQEEEHLD